MYVRVVKAAAADAVDSRQSDEELTSDSSSCENADSCGAQQTVPNASNTLECAGDVVAEQRHAREMKEHLSSLNTASNAHGDQSPLPSDFADSSPATDNCCDTDSVESLTENSPVDKLADEELVSETEAVCRSVAADGVETDSGELSTVLVDGVQRQSQPPSSLVDSIGICEEDMVSSTDCSMASDAGCDAGSATVPAGSCTVTPCHCSSNVSSEVAAADDHMGEPPPEPKSEDAENSSRHLCDDSESVLLPTESESAQPLCSVGQSDAACEKELDVNETSWQASSIAAEIVPTPPSNVHDLLTLALSSSVSQVVSSMVMESKPEAAEGISSTIGGISLMMEADCEHGGKASKLDQPSSAECFASDDLEESDTGALHMSVGFQLTLQNSKVVEMYDGDSDMTRDTSIGVLMVCDDDGLVSSVGAEPSAVVAESCEDGAVVSSDDGDYESLVAELPASFSSQLSDETATEKRPSDVSVVLSSPVDENLTEASEAVAVEDVMLCEVESRSHEMRELLADIAQNAIDTSHEAQLSDTANFSHDDSELCHRLTLKINTRTYVQRIDNDPGRLR